MSHPQIQALVAHDAGVTGEAREPSRAADGGSPGRVARHSPSPTRRS